MWKCWMTMLRLTPVNEDFGMKSSGESMTMGLRLRNAHQCL
jgi:hypothetical protein